MTRSGRNTALTASTCWHTALGTAKNNVVELEVATIADLMESDRAPILPGGETGPAGFGSTTTGNATAETTAIPASQQPVASLSLRSRNPGLVVSASASSGWSPGNGGVTGTKPSLLVQDDESDDMHLTMWQPPSSIIAVHRELFMLRRSGTFESQPMSVVWDDDAPPSCAPLPDALRVSGFRIIVCNLIKAGDAQFLTAERVGLVVTILDNQIAPGEAPVSHTTALQGAGFVSDLDELRSRVARVPTVRQHACFDLGDCDDSRGAMLSVFQRAGHAIDACRRRGETAIVHCRAGVSRSPAVALSWMERRGIPLESAISHILAVRPQVQPNYGFFASLLRWAEPHDAELAVASSRKSESRSGHTRTRSRSTTATPSKGIAGTWSSDRPESAGGSDTGMGGATPGGGSFGIAMTQGTVTAIDSSLSLPSRAQQAVSSLTRISHGSAEVSAKASLQDTTSNQQPSAAADSLPYVPGDRLGLEGGMALRQGQDDRSGFSGHSQATPATAYADGEAMLSPLSTLESVASDSGRDTAGIGFVRDVTARRDDALGSQANDSHHHHHHQQEEEEEDELSLSASAAGGKLASALTTIAATLSAANPAGVNLSSSSAGDTGESVRAAVTAVKTPLRTHTVERPSSASVPTWLRYSDVAADRMARAIAQRIGMVLDTPPGSACLSSAMSSMSAYSGVGSLPSPGGRHLPTGAPTLHGLGGVLTVGSGSARQRPPRPSVESTASMDGDADAMAAGWASGTAAGGGSRGDATPDSSASTPKKHHRRRLLAPGGAELSLMVDP